MWALPNITAPEHSHTRPQTFSQKPTMVEPRTLVTGIGEEGILYQLLLCWERARIESDSKQIHTHKTSPGRISTSYPKGLSLLNGEICVSMLWEYSLRFGNLGG